MLLSPASFVGELALLDGAAEAAKESNSIAVIQSAYQQAQLGTTDSER